MNVTFGHPKDSTKSLEVDVSPDLTGEKALIGLQTDYGQGAFVPPPAPGRDYLLVVNRTRNQIAPDQKFGSLELVEGEWISIQEGVIGAG